MDTWRRERRDLTAVGPEAVDGALTTRRSIRGFRPDPVPLDLVRHLLTVSSRAPSGSNIQPWKVYVLTGAALERLKAELVETFLSGEPEQRAYHYYPQNWRSPYIERRRHVGWKLYELAGVARGDREAGDRQRARNYRFFGAPVGLVFSVDKDMEIGSWLDCGMFIQNVMVAARGHGLDTCAQAAIANYPAIVARHLGIPDTETVICGMALGWADLDEPTNALRSPREPVDAFATFLDA